MKSLLSTLFLRRDLDLAEVARFGAVGIANTVLAYGVFLLALFLGIPYYGALVFDYLFAIVFSLLVNGHFTFRRGAHVGPRMFFRMAALYGLLFVLNEGLLLILVALIGLNAAIGQAIASVILAGVSYVLQKNLVFRISQKKDKAE
jgi:putative flippase GtrA